jgi:hypothetical protein
MTERAKSADMAWPLPGSTTTAMKAALSADMRQCRLSRAQIADQLSFRAGRKISEAMLDNFAAESKEHRFPADLVCLWVRITGSRRLLDAIADEAGYHIVDEVGKRLMDIGAAQVEWERAEAKLRGAKDRIWDRL